MCEVFNSGIPSVPVSWLFRSSVQLQRDPSPAQLLLPLLYFTLILTHEQLLAEKYLITAHEVSQSDQRKFRV